MTARLVVLAGGGVARHRPAPTRPQPSAAVDDLTELCWLILLLVGRIAHLPTGTACERRNRRLLSAEAAGLAAQAQRGPVGGHLSPADVKSLTENTRRALARVDRLRSAPPGPGAAQPQTGPHLYLVTSAPP